MAFSKRNVATWVFLLLGFGVLLDLSSVFASAAGSGGSHKCSHGHHDHDHDHHHHHSSHESSAKLPEELAEEEDMKLYGFGFHDHEDHKDEPFGLLQLSGLGLWVHALGCSFLVSMASLICLIILPVIFVHGKPSKAVVDSLALFGAGAMLGDAFLHQLPHAFGGGHSHNHHEDDKHDHGDHNHGNSHSHAHSLADLSVGLSVLAGIVIFLLVEKAVRYVEDNSGRSHNHGHHHHHRHNKLKDDNDSVDEKQPKSPKTEDERAESLDEALSKLPKEESKNGSQIRRRRMVSDGEENDKQDSGTTKSSSSAEGKASKEEQDKPPQSSSLVFGYLNLFSDGVHNFTDGMALGSAFLLYGTVGGWSRTLFLLAHELPQEVGDFGILVRSGFSVSEALFFNFLSALVALFGTALALLWGRDPGQSSLIEGFTAGGFIYIAVAGVLAEMNSNGKTTLKSVATQLTSLTLGMTVALCISLVE